MAQCNKVMHGSHIVKLQITCDLLLVYVCHRTAHFIFVTRVLYCSWLSIARDVEYQHTLNVSIMSHEVWLSLLALSVIVSGSDWIPRQNLRCLRSQ